MTSVIIVAANSGDDLVTCVDRVSASSTSVEVIVSDNGSSDGSIESVAARYASDARVRILRNGCNLGFGAACNRAIRVASAEVLLLLNPDCRIEPDTIRRLNEIMSSDKRIGIAGAIIVNASGKYERASRRRDPFIKRALMTMTGLDRFQSQSSIFEGVEIPEVSASVSVDDVDAVSGALMMIRRGIFERIGGFDEGYFLHCEDLDVCRRVRDTGARVVCANEIRVVHLKGTSSRARPVFVERHKHHGMWRWFNKFDPAAHNRFVRALVWLGLSAHFTVVRARIALSRQR